MPSTPFLGRSHLLRAHQLGFTTEPYGSSCAPSSETGHVRHHPSLWHRFRGWAQILVCTVSALSCVPGDGVWFLPVLRDCSTVSYTPSPLPPLFPYLCSVFRLWDVLFFFFSVLPPPVLIDLIYSGFGVSFFWAGLALSTFLPHVKAGIVSIPDLLSFRPAFA